MTRERPPKTVQDALTRAAEHGRRAAAEAVRAAIALLDAAALAAVGKPAAANPAFTPLARLLQDLAGELDPGTTEGGAGVVGDVIEALGDEIQRWEQRATEDPEARAVLRTLIGLRELLWEVGARPSSAKPRKASPRPRSRRDAASPRNAARPQ